MTPQSTTHRPFEALSIPGFAPFVGTYMLTMMADNVEHVISYWVVFQKFNSPALGGFAVISHWLPFLVLSFGVGALNDRYDSRRLIQVGGAIFALVSMAWGYFFFTDTLTMTKAMLLLVMHGVAGVFWSTSSQVLLYQIAGPQKLASAVRLGATARYLGMLVGPGVGSLLMTFLGPKMGIVVNASLYLPLLIWLGVTRYGTRAGAEVAKRLHKKLEGFRDVAKTLGAVRTQPVLWFSILLSGLASCLIGNSYHAQMPGFAAEMGGLQPGRAYALLLGADAAGALIAGLMLEMGMRVTRVSLRASMGFALGWGIALGAFALTRNYFLALTFLVAAGFCELSFSSMNQTLVQMHAPDGIRGKVLGLFGMSASGLRLFSGIVVGLVGGVWTIHASLLGAAATFVVGVGWLRRRARLRGVLGTH